MKRIEGIGLSDVQGVYGGFEADLWELVMGQQIHIGGMASSMALADAAEIQPGTYGVDLCCCAGAGMRFLVRFRSVGRMTGVDATIRMIERGRAHTKDEGMADRINFVPGDATATSLSWNSADFVWGEDAWCYVENKPKLIAEAAHLVRSGGAIAFTDWVEGPKPMSEEEGQRLLKFMKFPNIATIDEYAAMLHGAGCAVRTAKDTGRFAPCVDLYLNMLTMQLTSDALRIIGHDQDLMGVLAREMQFMQGLAHEGKLIQSMFVAMKA